MPSMTETISGWKRKSLWLLDGTDTRTVPMRNIRGGLKMLKDVKKQKTISEQMEEIKEEMCSEFCKYPIIWDQRDGELSDSYYCQNCPLNRL